MEATPHDSTLKCHATSLPSVLWMSPKKQKPFHPKLPKPPTKTAAGRRSGAGLFGAHSCIRSARAREPPRRSRHRVGRRPGLGSQNDRKAWVAVEVAGWRPSPVKGKERKERKGKDVGESRDFGGGKEGFCPTTRSFKPTCPEGVRCPPRTDVVAHRKGAFKPKGTQRLEAP